MEPCLLPSSNTPQEIAHINQKFKALPDYEQVILRVLAVVYVPVLVKAIKELMDELVRVDFLPGNLQDYKLPTARKNALIEEGLLILEDQRLRVPMILGNTLIANFAELPTTHDLSPQEKLARVILLSESHMVTEVRYHSQNSEYSVTRRIRNAWFTKQLNQMSSLLLFSDDPQTILYHRNDVLVDLFFLPFELGSFVTLATNIQYQAIASLLRRYQIAGANCDYPISLLEQVCAYHQQHSNDDIAAHLYCLLAEQYLYQNRLEVFEAIATPLHTAYALQLKGIYAFINRDLPHSVELFQAGCDAKRKLNRVKYAYLPGLPGYFYKLALTVLGHTENASYFNDVVKQLRAEFKDHHYQEGFRAAVYILEAMCLSLRNSTTFDERIDYIHFAEEDAFNYAHFVMLFLLAYTWCNQAKAPSLKVLADKTEATFQNMGYTLFAHICHQVGCYHSGAKLSADLGKMTNFATLISPKADWDLALDKLLAMATGTAKKKRKTTSDKALRLIWIFDDKEYFQLKPKEQKLNKSGWTKGRPVALKTLLKDHESMAHLSDTDHKICNAIETYQTSGYYPKTVYELEGGRALKAAVGIDNLYCGEDAQQPVELLEKTPELLITELNDELCLSIPDYSDCWQDYNTYQNFSLTRIKPSQYQVTFFTQEHTKVAEIIGEEGLLIPKSAKQKVIASLTAVAPLLNIQSDLPELDTGLESLPCDPNLIINIQPHQQGLSFTCTVMPFGESGPAFKPGVGNTQITADVEGRRVATKRDLQTEEMLLDKLDQACPAFLAMSDNVLLADELSAALEVLEQLEVIAEAGSMDLLLRWPKGKTLKLSQQMKAENLLLSMGQSKEWFDIAGELQFDNEQVLELRKLLELMSGTSGRFIQLDQQQILVLSSELRQKLDQINQITDEGKFPPLASLQMEEATTGMRMKTLHAWKKQTQKMHEANAIEPLVPSTFQGELRDYQLAGFDWAARLSHWGAGACLADDMGLGKTMQALAMLLYRAGDGPGMVLAPTSVCLNWQQEALKFTPTLNIKIFGQATSTEDRQHLLSDLKPHDVVVVSYGLLQRESELLKAVHWHTIVADEAQALKNPLAQRTKAAFALKADFKMVTTGTPIENDLTELWSLFRFVNPGLLGNFKRFADRFAQPMENAKEDRLKAHKAAQSLKTLIRPFMLRRMKNQVLTELPSRTEITVKVAMSDKERSFYEALRLNAIDNITEASELKGGEQRIKMLAELMQLRQACCHPKLVTPELAIPSSKLDALDELLQELRLNDHKALIFSQFVGYLKLIEAHVKARGFSYQYLDGSTPQKQRQKRVDAFQEGGSDLFLISLKAGGSGLNLTAADYVIHMDPWWNPAVEEQASDRAHRMGQKRPVTIYRLVTQNTIEEKIVELHQHKRDLADKVLSGNEVATKLSVNDVLVLLKDTM